MGLDQQGRQAAGVVLRPKVHTVRRDIIKHDGLAAPQRISSMLKGFGFHWIMGRHIPLANAMARKAQISVTPTQLGLWGGTEMSLLLLEEE